MAYQSVIRAALQVLLAGLLWSLPAVAQQRMAAEKLFSEGAALMDSGEFAEACPKLEESQRLDPAGGTVLLLAHCYEGMGKTASAWQQFKSAISWARRDGRPEREELAAEHAKELEARLSRVAIDVPPDVEAIEGLRVEVDGTEFGRAMWGTQIPLDPGEHVVRSTAPGYKDVEQRVVLGTEGDLKVVTIPKLEPGQGTAQQVDKSAPAGQEALPADEGLEEPQDDGQTQRIIAYVVGGVGVVSLGVGTVFGIQALSKQSEAEDRCPSSPCADRAGVDANDDAKTFANVSNVGIGVGVVALGVATYLFLTAPDSEPETAELSAVRVDPVVGPGVGGLSVGGAF